MCSSFCEAETTFASSSCTFALRGLRSAALPTAFARGQALKRPLTPRISCAIPLSNGSCTAPRGEAAGPPRRADVQLSCLLQNPQSILRGELAPLRLDPRPPGPALAARGWLHAPKEEIASSRRSSTHQGRSNPSHGAMSIDSLSAGPIGIRPPAAATVMSQASDQDAGVSRMRNMCREPPVHHGRCEPRQLSASARARDA